jgi:hypothetical protein
MTRFNILLPYAYFLVKQSFYTFMLELCALQKRIINDSYIDVHLSCSCDSIIFLCFHSIHCKMCTNVCKCQMKKKKFLNNATGTFWAHAVKVRNVLNLRACTFSRATFLFSLLHIAMLVRASHWIFVTSCLAQHLLLFKNNCSFIMNGSCAYNHMKLH